MATYKVSVFLGIIAVLMIIALKLWQDSNFIDERRDYISCLKSELGLGSALGPKICTDLYEGLVTKIYHFPGK